MSIDDIQDLLELASRYGVTHLRSGDVEFTISKDAEAPKPADVLLTPIEDLSAVPAGPRESKSLYDHRTLFPNGKPGFPANRKED